LQKQLPLVKRTCPCLCSDLSMGASTQPCCSVPIANQSCCEVPLASTEKQDWKTFIPISCLSKVDEPPKTQCSEVQCSYDDSPCTQPRTLSYSEFIARGRQSVLEEWLTGTIHDGHPVIILTPCPLILGMQISSPSKVPSMMYLNSALMTLTILSNGFNEALEVTIFIDSIQSICSAEHGIALLAELAAIVSEGEKTQSILLQYISSDGVARHIFFIEESERAKDLFIQEFRLICIARRDGHT